MGSQSVIERFEHCAASTRLVEGQVVGKVKVGHRAPAVRYTNERLG